MSIRRPPIAAPRAPAPPAPSAERLEQRLAWAREQVGVERGATLDDARRRFFAALEDESFVPDESLDRAFRTLRWEAEGIIDAEDPPEFLVAEERELYDEVGRFAAEMFSLPVGQRRQRWSDLYRRCEHIVRLRTRLEMLAPGLDLDLNAMSDAGREMHVKTLARYAMELFPLRPTARASRRHALLQTLAKDDMKPWRKAAQRLKTQHPKIAALAPEFIGQLATWGQTPKVRPPDVSVRREPSGRGAGWALGVAAVIFLSFIVRAALRTSDSLSTGQPDQSQRIERLMDDLRKQQLQNQPPPQPVSPWRQDAEQDPPFGPDVRRNEPFGSSTMNERVNEILQRHRQQRERIQEEQNARLRGGSEGAPGPTWGPDGRYRFRPPASSPSPQPAIPGSPGFGP